MDKKKVICLISGGLDSATLMAYAHEQGHEIYGMFADYRQKTLETERRCSKLLCENYNAKAYKEVDLGCLSEIGGSGLFKSEKEVLLTSDNLLLQYVPFRNSILIAMAAAWAEVIKADLIYVGATGGPWTSPDNSPEYFKAYNEILSIGTMLKDNLKVEAPFNYMSKREVVELGIKMRVPYELSWSCHNYSDKACGVCSNCLDRLKGFKEAGTTDPIPYCQEDILFDLVGIDSPSVDYILNFEYFPKADTKEEILESSRQGGGKVATGLAAAANMGISSAALGTIGEDKLGSFSVKELERFHVDCKGLLCRKGSSTGYAMVLSDRKEGGRFVGYGRATAKPLLIEELSREHLQHCKMLFVAKQDELALEAIKIAKKAGAVIMLDPDYKNPLSEDFLSMVDIVIGSEFSYESLYPKLRLEEACDKVLEAGPEMAVFTLGKRGCVGKIRGSKYLEIPVFSVEVVDSLGAGDVFHGAFAAAFLKGMNFKDSLIFSSAAAAINCTFIGGRNGVPTFNQVQCFLNTYLPT